MWDEIEPDDVGGSSQDTTQMGSEEENDVDKVSRMLLAEIIGKRLLGKMGIDYLQRRCIGS